MAGNGALLLPRLGRTHPAPGSVEFEIAAAAHKMTVDKLEENILDVRTNVYTRKHAFSSLSLSLSLSRRLVQVSREPPPPRDARTCLFRERKGDEHTRGVTRIKRESGGTDSLTCDRLVRMFGKLCRWTACENCGRYCRRSRIYR